MRTLSLTYRQCDTIRAALVCYATALKHAAPIPKDAISIAETNGAALDYEEILKLLTTLTDA